MRWDLAKGARKNATLGTELVEIALELAKQHEERLRTSPAFGQGRVVDSGDAATSQARFLSILGREA